MIEAEAPFRVHYEMPPGGVHIGHDGSGPTMPSTLSGMLRFMADVIDFAASESAEVREAFAEAGPAWICTVHVGATFEIQAVPQRAAMN